MSSKITFNCETIRHGINHWGVYYEGRRVGVFSAWRHPSEMPDFQREEIASLFAQVATGEKEFFEVAERILIFTSF